MTLNILKSRWRHWMPEMKVIQLSKQQFSCFLNVCCSRQSVFFFVWFHFSSIKSTHKLYLCYNKQDACSKFVRPNKNLEGKNVQKPISFSVAHSKLHRFREWRRTRFGRQQPAHRRLQRISSMYNWNQLSERWFWNNDLIDAMPGMLTSEAI